MRADTIVFPEKNDLLTMKYGAFVSARACPSVSGHSQFYRKKHMYTFSMLIPLANEPLTRPCMRLATQSIKKRTLIIILKYLVERVLVNKCH